MFVLAITLYLMAHFLQSDKVTHILRVSHQIKEELREPLVQFCDVWYKFKDCYWYQLFTRVQVRLELERRMQRVFRVAYLVRQVCNGTSHTVCYKSVFSMASTLPYILLETSHFFKIFLAPRFFTFRSFQHLFFEQFCVN